MNRKILIAEDQPLMTRSMRLLCRDEDLGAPVEVNSCRDLLAALEKADFSHLLLDLTLADGNAMSILDRIKVSYPDLQVMVYSDKPEKLYAQIFRERYAMRFLSKDEKEEVALVRILSFFKNRELYIRPVKDPETPFDRLTSTEKELVPFFLKGMSPNEIGQQIGKSSSAIRTHKQSILEKTETANVVELKELAELYNIEPSTLKSGRSSRKKKR
jgi:DNA-binding NarL/FixJ family response regulator